MVRIAKGSGHAVIEVQMLLEEHKRLAKMFKSAPNGPGSPGHCFIPVLRRKALWLKQNAFCQSRAQRQSHPALPGSNGCTPSVRSAAGCI